MTTRYRIKKINRLPANIFQLFLKPCKDEDYFDFHAGQYIYIVNSNGEKRPYSIATAQNEDDILELHIKPVDNIPYMQQLFKKLIVNQTLTIEGPFGHSYVDINQHYKKVILAAGGTGFAPCKAIIESILSQFEEEEEITTEIYLYWSAKSDAELYYAIQLKAWREVYKQIHFKPIITDTKESKLLAETILTDHSDFTDTTFFAFGPFDMSLTLRDILVNAGIDEKNILSDAFEFENTV